MKSLIRYFAQRHLLANLLTFSILVLGYMSLTSMKRDMFPAVDLDELVVTTRYPGASPEDVELNVTNKLENELKSVDGIDIMTSYSLENISVINITLDSGAGDTEKFKRDIRDAVNRVTNFPPEVTDAPAVFEIKTENFEIIRVGMGGSIPYAELAAHARQFEKKLKDIKGVSGVYKTGYLAREIKIEVSQQKMEEYQIPLRDIMAAIQLRNIRATGGSFESYTSDKSIVTLAQFREPQEVGDVIVRSTFEGPRILIKDLAVIRDGFEPEKTRFRMNGKAVIGFTITKQSSADVIRVVEEIKQLVEHERANLPPGVELEYSSDESRFVRSMLQIMITNGLIGLFLVIAVLFVFLDFRTAFWVAMGIPLSLMAVFIISPFFNASINMLTLMGLIIVLGLIVDDAIVIAENISTRREMGDLPLDAAVNGTYNVLRPVFATIITTTLAFGPFFFMSGIMGKFMWAFPLIIILALAVSFVEALTILPAHVTGGRANMRGGARVTKRNWFIPIRQGFERMLMGLLRFRYLVIAFFVSMLIGAFAYAGKHMQFVLFPGDIADQFYIIVELETGTSLRATTDQVNRIEELLDELPAEEMVSYWTVIGSQTGGGGPPFSPGESENWALSAVTLTPYNVRGRSANEIVDELRTRTDELFGSEVVRYFVDAGGPPVGSAITLRVVGNDDARRKALADAVVDFLGTMEGVTEINRDDKLGKEQVSIIPDHVRLSQLGLTVADIARNVRLAYDGEVITKVRYGDEDVGFRIIMEESARQQPGYLGDLQIPNRQGRLIPLKDVASFEIGPGPSAFYHYQGDRAVRITADLEKGSPMTPLQATKAIVDRFDLASDWPGMRFVVGGEAQETQESMVSLGKAMGMAGIGIYLVLVLLFNSMTQPILVMFAIPFGLIGIIAAFSLHGEPLGFLAMMGVIGMMGVVVNDSLILVNHINSHRPGTKDEDYLKLVAKGTASRFRPILLTSITTVAGLLPTAYGLGGYNAFIAPMALALGYGILFATPLTLLLLPSLYMVQHDIGKLIRKIPGLESYYFIPAAGEEQAGALLEEAKVEVEGV
ncbi:MAG: efflux RND transporter permease subunit [Candidatus Marinimicrobia bacterium]|nr:efflux RND transporter permease subunit [Candidatus Neomarinimicrobiota bacterium]